MASKGIYIDFWKQILRQLTAALKNGEIDIKIDVSEIQLLGDREKSGYQGKLDLEFGSVIKCKDSAPFRDFRDVIKADNSDFKFFSIHRLYIEVNRFELRARIYLGDDATLINHYKKLIKNGNTSEIYKWELIEKFKGKPDTSAPDFGAEISTIDYKNLIFHNGIAVRNKLATTVSEEYRNAFISLFNEKQGLSQRILKFRITIGELYKAQGYDLQSHHDERTIATFLAFKFPDNYALYKETIYLGYCRYKGLKPKPVNEKYLHYLDLIKSFIRTAIIPDEELIESVESFKNKSCYEDPNFLILAQDILYQVLNKGIEENYAENDQDMGHQQNIESIKNNFPLNQILYGPPGTGKTYHTVNKALEIIGVDISELNRSEIKEAYDAKVAEGQIVFTTFHQSMSYEDFVEGIKPEIEEDKDGIRSVVYAIQDGIFKALCIKAKFSTVKQEQPLIYEFDEAWNDLLAEVEASEDAMDDFILDILTPKRGLKVTEITDQGNLRLTPISVVGLNYTVSYTRAKKLQAAFPDLSLVKNIDKEFRSVIGGSNSTAYWAVINNLNIKIAKNQSVVELDNAVLKPHVIIIDEINRGNISAIFGELITLIEEGKRAGSNEALELILPYSKERFSVPNNVYLIGTMNTADRSVEALDSALRRRFSFSEMKPQSNLLHEQVFNGISLAEVLEVVNQRIEVLLDTDHQIGHSYLINVKDLGELANAFNNSIVPLLQEYFYHDEEKIFLVLGDSFVKPKPADDALHLLFPMANDTNVRLPQIKQRYEILQVDETTIIYALARMLGNE